MSVKERPILMSGPMVRALLAGRKTQTRRIVKQQPSGNENFPPSLNDNVWYFRDAYYACEENDIGNYVACPYGKIGDRLWVKEAFQIWHGRPEGWKDYSIWYAADGAVATYWPNYNKGQIDKIDAFTVKHANEKKLMPSLFMPRWASRITLEITGVRVERLKDISGADCIAEQGPLICRNEAGFTWEAEPKISKELRFLRDRYANLWDSINGKGAWDKNPYLWVVEFKVL